MDIVTTAIVSALNTQNRDFLKSIYDDLKSTLARKFGKNSDLLDAVNRLEKKPASQGRKATLQEEVDNASVNESPEILQLAQDLLKKLTDQANEKQFISQTQTNIVREVNLESRSGSNIFKFAPVQVGGDAASSSSINQPKIQDDDFKDIFALLSQLKHDIAQNEELNPLVKDSVRDKVEQLEKTLQTPKPDKGFIQNTIQALEQGLKGVATLAEPTAKVASLITKAWGISLL